jgi:hypothetical protein
MRRSTTLITSSMFKQSKRIWFIFFLALCSIVSGFFLSELLITPASAAPEWPPPTELLIVVPYKTPSAVAQQENEDWITEGNRLRNYKCNTGLGALMITLNDVNRDYEGRDEPERIKRAIYTYALDHGIKYVMLVGKADLMPVRYQSTGYTTNGDTLYSGSEQYCRDVYCTAGGTNCTWYCTGHPSHCDGAGNILWCPYPAYKFIPNDGYYANLWDNSDPAKAFDDWDYDEDDFFGEYYYDNYRGVDRNTMHPDVALGRVPVQSPDEFAVFINKIMAYEDAIDGMRPSPAYRKALLTASSWAAENYRSLRDNLGSAFEITYLEVESGTYTIEHPDGSQEITITPSTFITDFITANTPHFVGYDGHGNPNSWSEMQFGWRHAAGLSQVLPVIAGTRSCSTARLAEVQQFVNPQTVPITTSAVVAQSMAEAFIARADGGAAVYLGSVTTARGGASHIERRFFQAMSENPGTAGDAWLSALEDYVDDFRLDMVTGSSWTNEPTHPDGGAWSRPPLGDYYKMHFFGDPSLRLDGEQGLDVHHPFTRILYVRYVHVDPAPFYRRIRFVAIDKESDAITTRYRYRTGKSWSPWLSGSEFYLSLAAAESMEEKREYDAVVEYHSIDRSGNREAVQSEKIIFDVSEEISNRSTGKMLLRPSFKKAGIHVKGKVIDEKGRPLRATILLEGKTQRRETETDAQGWYDFSNVADGSYILQIAQAPAGYRQYVPEEKYYRVNVQGDSFERGFVLVPEDHVTPTMTQEVPWDVAAASGCIYGIAYDDWYGTGVKGVKLGVTDAKGRWLSIKETWLEDEIWFTPQYVMPLDEFLGSDVHKVAFDRLPQDFRQAGLSALESMHDGKSNPLIWIHSFSDSSLLSKGAIVIHGKAIDTAGNVSQIEVTNTDMIADFDFVVDEEAPLTVAFNNKSLGHIAEIEWDFGDGEMSLLNNPKHTYQKPGKFKVTLSVGGPYAWHSTAKEVQVIGKGD